MIHVEKATPTVDTTHEVEGKINGTRFKVSVLSRNGNVHTVSHQDLVLAKKLTDDERRELFKEMKERFSQTI